MMKTRYSFVRELSRLEKLTVLAVVILPFAAFVCGVILLWNRLVTVEDLSILGIFYVGTVSGIGVGFHRMMTHKSFDSPEWVRAIFLALGSMALEGSTVEWGATHRVHHANSDKDGDPHSPLKGFWHAHFGWLFRDRVIKTSHWAEPFNNDPLVHWFDKTFTLWTAASFALPGIFGLLWTGTWNGFLSAVLWGGLIRIFLVHHVTWSVNSVCHTFGRLEFKSNDRSRNEWIVGLLGFEYKKANSQSNRRMPESSGMCRRRSAETSGFVRKVKAPYAFSIRFYIPS